jgi:hypothetical protein
MGFFIHQQDPFDACHEAADAQRAVFDDPVIPDGNKNSSKSRAGKSWTDRSLRLCLLKNSEGIWPTQIQPLFTDDEEFGRDITMGKKQNKLGEEQVSEIADRVEAQLQKKQAPATAGADRSGQGRAYGRGSAYLMGAASGLVLALAAPFLRPVMRSAVKGGILAGRYARQVGSGLKEEFEDIVAEAQSDLDKEKGKSEGEAEAQVE